MKFFCTFSNHLYKSTFFNFNHFFNFDNNIFIISKNVQIDDKIIKLFDEEGNEVSFNVVAFFDIVNPETDEKNEYVIVYEEGYSEDDTFALKVINGEDGEELLEAIDNEVELAAVQEAYNTIFIDEE